MVTLYILLYNSYQEQIQFYNKITPETLLNLMRNKLRLQILDGLTSIAGHRIRVLMLQHRLRQSSLRRILGLLLRLKGIPVLLHLKRVVVQSLFRRILRMFLRLKWAPTLL